MGPFGALVHFCVNAFCGTNILFLIERIKRYGCIFRFCVTGSDVGEIYF